MGSFTPVEIPMIGKVVLHYTILEHLGGGGPARRSPPYLSRSGPW